MSPQALTDADLLDQTTKVDPVPAAGPIGDAATTHAEVEPAHPRLTVRELQIAIEAARNLAGRTPAAGTSTRPLVDEPVGAGGADRSRAALCHDALERNPPVTRPIVAPAPADASTSRTGPETATRRPDAGAAASQDRAEPWLPEHDGPVSLTGVSAPRTRTVRRASATPDKAARRPAKQRVSRITKTVAIDPAVAAAVIAAPPRIVVIPACGGAGATTATVLLAAALAPVIGALLVASGADRGSLSVRANASGGDVDALAAWTAQHSGQPLQSTTPGMASGSAGTGQLVLATAGRDDTGRPFDADTAAALLAAAASTRAAVLLDWSCPTPLPERIWASATHILIAAPATSPGLLDAEYAVQSLEGAMPRTTPLSVLTVDVRGRAPRWAGRAALARIEALNLPVTALPYDPALADDPRVHWPALRPRTRSAIVAALTHLLDLDLHPDQHRKDET